MREKMELVDMDVKKAIITILHILKDVKGKYRHNGRNGRIGNGISRAEKYNI